MHSYSLDTPVRKTAHFAIALAAFVIPRAFTWATGLAFPGEVVSYPLSVGATFGALYWLFEHALWKKLIFWHHIPNLAGKWTATGVSSHKDPETNEPVRFTMTYIIKQSFSRIEIFGETEKSTSKSFMASLETDHAVPIFRYGFENTPKNTADDELQRHPGMIELRIEPDSRMTGDYFSGKHRLRYGELTLTKIPDAHTK